MEVKRVTTVTQLACVEQELAVGMLPVSAQLYTTKSPLSIERLQNSGTIDKDQ